MSTRGRRSRGRGSRTPLLGRAILNSNFTVVKKPKAYETNTNSQPSSRSSTPLSKRSVSSKSVSNNVEDPENEFISGNFLDNSCGESSDGDSDQGNEDDKADEAFSDHSMNDTQSLISEDSLSSTGQFKLLSRPKTPDLVDDPDIPIFNLPHSCTDLLISNEHLMQTLGIYEVIWHFRTTLKLSPFKFEDFCAALLNEDQCALLAHLHIALMKAILREDENAGATLGPQDLKDTVNIALFFLDGMTWPEIIRLYMESDSHPEFKAALQCLETGHYPFVPLTNKLTVLQTLTDLFLSTTPVREELINEGNIRYDDHCRACHRLGDLLCCETCPAVYHLMCVDPPLEEVPEEDWQCSICQKHEIKGLTDCMSEVEKSRMMSRQDPLGYDRHGRKYYFLIRRIIVCSETEVWYYSTKAHLDELMQSLDSSHWEYFLYLALDQYRSEIYRQMDITLELTKAASGTKQTMLEYELGEIKKVQAERAKKLADEEAALKLKEELSNQLQESGHNHEQPGVDALTTSSHTTEAVSEETNSETVVCSSITSSVQSAENTTDVVSDADQETTVTTVTTVISTTTVVSTTECTSIATSLSSQGSTNVDATPTTMDGANTSLGDVSSTQEEQPTDMVVDSNETKHEVSSESNAQSAKSARKSYPVKIIKSPNSLDATSLMPGVKVTTVKDLGERKSGKTVVFINKDGKITLSAVADENKDGDANKADESIETQIASGRKMVTRSKTGSLTPKLFSDSITATTGSLAKAKSASSNSSEETLITEDDLGKIIKTKTQSVTSTSTSTSHISSTYFRLGQEGKYKQYHNEFSTNQLALNKHQHNEDRDRKRYLSHKFSLTPLSEFKWSGSLHGNRTLTITTLRASITQLENNIPTPFLHPNWPLHRQNWQKAVHMCQNPNDFALALAILEACIKPVLFNTVWKEALG